MRVLVLSDIHANLAALEAVLEDAKGQGYDAVWCLGDTVGYGPEPDGCIAQIRLLQALCVLGNHDSAVAGRMESDDFNDEARRAVEWTRQNLSLENMAWLGDLPSTPVVADNATMTHGSPRNPVWEYILYPSTARENFNHFATDYCLVGHTHVPALHVWRQGNPNVRALSPAAGQPVVLQNPETDYVKQRFILNPGSVGQPRDNDPRAAYAIFDTAEGIWTPRRVTYPIEITQAHMRAARLPERLINRLGFGW